MKLTKMEQRWTRAVFETIFPGSQELGLVSVKEMNVEGFADDLGTYAPSRAVFGFRMALFVITFSPLCVVGKLAMFGGLPEATRVKLLEKLSNSRNYFIRQFVLMMKAMGALLYAGSPAVRARLQDGVVAAGASSGPRMKEEALVTLRAKPHAA